jgi:hypothetical protein
MFRAKTAIAIAIFALSAIGSSAASAAVAGWLVNGTLLTGTQTATVATTAAVDQNYVAKFKEVTITCTGGALGGAEAKIEAPNKDSATSLTFKNCSAGGACELEGQPVNLSTYPVAAEATLEGALGLAAVLRPKSGVTFATFKFAEKSSCAISGEKLAVTGEAPATAPTGQDERTLQLLSFNISAASERLKVGSSAASFEGSALLKLASSLPWSFM